jgi:hypothetical protein
VWIEGGVAAVRCGSDDNTPKRRRDEEGRRASTWIRPRGRVVRMGGLS